MATARLTKHQLLLTTTAGALAAKLNDILYCSCTEGAYFKLRHDEAIVGKRSPELILHDIRDSEMLDE